MNTTTNEDGISHDSINSVASIENIKHFLGNKHTTGALLIDGRWGSGRMHFINNTLRNDPDVSERYEFIVTSLFGIKDLEELNKRIRSLFFHLTLKKKGVFGDAIGKTDTAIQNSRDTIRSLSDVLVNGLEATDLKKYSPAIKAITSLFTLDWHFWPLSNEIKTGKPPKDKTLSVVLVFDDLDRYIASRESKQQELYEVMGFISDFVEDKKFKVIVLADESEIKSESYPKIKEKTFAQTLYFKPNVDTGFDEIISRFEYSYREFLIARKAAIVNSFCECGKENVRSLINGLALFDRLRPKLDGFSLELTEGVLASALSTYFVSSRGEKVTTHTGGPPRNKVLVKSFVSPEAECELDESVEHGTGEQAADGEQERIAAMAASIKKNPFFMNTLADWIENGHFDEREFDIELSGIVRNVG